MSTKQLTGLLVGAHFRPPAKVVLERLPSGCDLELRPEPSNDYDPFAVQVWVKTSAIPAEKQDESLEELLNSCGWTIEELFQQEELQLGYLAREGNKALNEINSGEEGLVVSNEVFLKGREVVDWEECEIKLRFAMNGLPLVVLTAP